MGLSVAISNNQRPSEVDPGESTVKVSADFCYLWDKFCKVFYQARYSDFAIWLLRHRKPRAVFLGHWQMVETRATRIVLWSRTTNREASINSCGMGPENQLCPSLKATAWVERKQESEVDEGTSIYHLLCPFFLSTDGSGSHGIFSSPKTPALQGTWTDGLSALSKCRGITGADHWITRSEATNVGLVFIPVLSGEIRLLYVIIQFFCLWRFAKIGYPRIIQVSRALQYENPVFLESPHDLRKPIFCPQSAHTGGFLDMATPTHDFAGVAQQRRLSWTLYFISW